MYSKEGLPLQGIYINLLNGSYFGDQPVFFVNVSLIGRFGAAFQC